MRKLIASLVIIVLLIILLPLASGIVAQKKFMNFIAAVSRTPNAKLEVKNYSRGWLQSTADVEVLIPNSGISPATIKGPLTLNLHQVIKHGPIVFADHTIKFGFANASSKLELSDKVKAALSDIIPAEAKLPQLYTHVFFPFTGGANVTTKLPAFNLEKERQGKFAWKGGEAHANFNRTMTKVDGDVSFDGFTVTTPNMEINQDKASISYQMKQVDGLWVGEGDFDYSKMLMQVEGKQKLLVTGLKTHSESNIEKHLFNMSAQVNLDKWQYEEQLYGPGKLDMELNKLDAIALLKINQQLEAANSQSMSEQEQKLLMLSVLPLLPSLLDKGPEFRIKALSLITPEGELQGSGYIAVAPDQKKGMLKILKRLSGEANIQLPKDLVKKWMTRSFAVKLVQEQAVQELMARQAKAAQRPSTAVPSVTRLTDNQIQTKAAEHTNTQVAQWIKEGYIIEEGKFYKVNIKLENEQLKVNGKNLASL